MSSIPLLRYAPHLLPAHHLNTITSLEINLDLDLTDPSAELSHEQQTQWSEYNFLVGSISSTFGALRRLDLSIRLNCRIVRSENRLNTDEAKLFGPIDGLTREYLPKLLVLEVAVSREWHANFMAKAKKAGALVEQPDIGGYSWNRFWRMVDGRGQEFMGSDLGYWIRQGYNDTPIVFACRMR